MLEKKNIQPMYQGWEFAHLLRSLTKNERIARFLSESLIPSFFRKKLAIRSENRQIPSPAMYMYVYVQYCRQRKVEIKGKGKERT